MVQEVIGVVWGIETIRGVTVPAPLAVTRSFVAAAAPIEADGREVQQPWRWMRRGDAMRSVAVEPSRRLPFVNV